MADASRFAGRGRSVLVAVAAVLGLSATSCGAPSFQYFKSPDETAYYKIPRHWTTYDTGQMLPALLASTHPEGVSPQLLTQQQPRNWIEGFTADPRVDPQHVAVLLSPVPVGYARLQALPKRVHDAISLVQLRNSPIAIDQVVKSHPDSIQISQQHELLFPGDFRGYQTIFVWKLSTNTLITVDQISLINPGSSVLYEFVVGCSSQCYSSNVDTINEIVSSWTVKEPA